jgi:hypothetical protein
MRSLSARHVTGCVLVAAAVALVPSVASATVRTRFIHPSQCMPKPGTAGTMTAFTSGNAIGQFTNSSANDTLVLWCPVPIDFYGSGPNVFPGTFLEVLVDGWSTTCGAGSKGLRARFCHTNVSGGAGACTASFAEPTNCNVVQHLSVQPAGSFPAESFPYVEVEIRGNASGSNTFFGYRLRTCDDSNC